VSHLRLRRRKGWTTVRVMSGLGNQLFQYATGRAVAQRTNTRLRFDISYVGHELNRPYALGDFHIPAKVVDGEPKDLTFMRDFAAEDAYVRERFGATMIRELDETHELEMLLGAPANSFLAGYWQNPAYFEEFSDQIRRELKPRMTAAISSGEATIAAAEQSVAVHVRRGDIANDPGMAQMFGALDPGYYRRAAQRMLESRPSAEFFLFSDDPEWCRTQLDLPGPTHLISGDNQAFEDLALISACGDAIIANSSFSWWGAWLGERPGSIVLAPAVPFKDQRLNEREYYPDRWQLV
jgi:hypothetical protein